MNEKVLEDKRRFLKAFENALIQDERSYVKDIALRYVPEHDDEYIEIFFTGGGRRQIYATGNSNYANAKEILKAVYE